MPKKINENVYFRNFMVQKESENFYGVYESCLNEKMGELITSGTSLNNAVKKAKLLQKGYNLRAEIDSKQFGGFCFDDMKSKNIN